jgi:hypothetical protein
MIGVTLSSPKVREIGYIVIFAVTQSDFLVFKSILSLSDIVTSYTLVKEYNVSQI